SPSPPRPTSPHFGRRRARDRFETRVSYCLPDRAYRKGHPGREWARGAKHSTFQAMTIGQGRGRRPVREAPCCYCAGADAAGAGDDDRVVPALSPSVLTVRVIGALVSIVIRAKRPSSYRPIWRPSFPKSLISKAIFFSSTAGPRGARGTVTSART